MEREKPDRRVIIVGGGISGLAAAERLVSLDPTWEVHLFEADDKLGGVLQSELIDGFCLELGPDSILSRLPWGVDLCRRIGLAAELISTNSSPSGVHVVCRGRLEPVPPGIAIMAPQRLWPMMTTPILSWPGKMRLAAEWFVPPRRSQEDESLASFVRRRLGRESLERLVQPLAGGIYMGDPEQLSIQAAFPQFVEMERKHGSLIRAARVNKTAVSGSPEAGGPQYSMFVAPRRGMTQIVSTLVNKLVGCRMWLRRRVERVTREADGDWRVEFVDEGTPSSQSVCCQGVIIALPAYHTAKVLAPNNPELSGLLASIPYAGCIAVNLAYERRAVPHPLDSFGFVAPHVEQRSILACTLSSVKYRDRAPEGKVLLRAYLGGACHPEVINWTDEQVLRAVLDELRQLLGVSDPPLFSRIARWPYTMPQYVVGHLLQVERIEELVDELSGLELAGNAYRGVGIPHCIRSGQQASERLLASLRAKDRAEAPA